jgi:hypothetical protein
MKVEVVEPQRQYQAIFEDEATVAVTTIVGAHRRLLRLVVAVVREYRTEESLRNRDPSLRKYARTYVREKSDRAPIDAICTSIEKLYREFNPDHVRGILIEAMLQDAIKTQYGGGKDLLDNNVKFAVLHNGDQYTSTTSIDVIGFSDDARIGECHDCKVRSKAFDKKWLLELIGSVAPLGFRIGLATADSEARALHALKDMGITLSPRYAVLITADRWPNLLPLQKVI